MKAILINLAVILVLVAMYYLDFWYWFSFENAFWYALGLAIIMMLIGLKVLGNPFGKRK